MVEGKQRYGKSKACRYATTRLKEKYGQTFPVFTLNCREHRVPSEAMFFEYVLEDVGHKLARKGNITAKRVRLIEYLYQQAMIADHRRLVLLADEAQRLRELHYKWLVDIYNDLERRDIGVTIILVGQPELIHQREVFIKGKHMQIVGRFMAHHHRFDGLKHETDIRQCLENYDDAEFPEETGWSFSRYYFPSLFEEGWRLASEASQVWQAFQQLKAESHLPGNTEIPMQYFARTVEYVMRYFGTLESQPYSLSLNQWREAVTKSGYCDACRYV